MMPQEKYFLGKIAIGYWYKRAVPVVVSLIKKCFLKEVKEQKGCWRSEGLASYLLVRTLNPPKEAATQGENTGRISQGPKNCIILHNPHELLLKSTGWPIRGQRELAPERNDTNEATIALTCW